MLTTQTLIVGAGLTGLHLATVLQDANHDAHLIEARPRTGGRIATNSLDGTAFDMGPAWFWPGQPRMDRLVTDLALPRFAQFAKGDLVMQARDGTTQRIQGYAAMAGSYRIDGGLTRITDALAATLPTDRLHLGDGLTALHDCGAHIQATLHSGARIHAQRVVLAMPPRLAAALAFDPALPPATHAALTAIPTWMAGQAKALAVYDSPFWRDAGLSGDANSQRGPMVEIHDASPAASGPFALFGFIGIPPQHRTDAAALRDAVQAQFTALFGPDAATPRALWIKDWAQDPLTATQADHAAMTHHPAYGRPPALAAHWGGRLIFAGSELAPDFGGYLEGALASGEQVFNDLTSTTGGPA